MPEFRVREEVVNVLLATLLQERGLVSVPETIRGALVKNERNVPDVLVADLQGVRVAIEGRFETGAAVGRRLTLDSLRRVEQGIAPICVGATYPTSLRSTDSLPALKSRLAESRLTFKVISDSGEGTWSKGTVADLADVLRRSYDVLASQDVVGGSVEDLDRSIERAAELTIQSSLRSRFRSILQIPRTTERVDFDEDLKVCRIAALTLANAMIFQQVLADRNSRVKTLGWTIDHDDVAEAFHQVWNFVLREIDYLPIFTTANSLVAEMTGSRDGSNALKLLANAASKITLRRAALRHDLMGRIYHLLLKDAKYFGAFYTTIPAATLLAKLAFNKNQRFLDWNDPERVADIKIGDLACGTGTLLKAALQAVVDNHVEACSEAGHAPAIDKIHSKTIEQSLWGLDVVPSAIHLAGAALALHNPEVEINQMNLFTLRTAGPNDSLGSIDLFATREIPMQADLFGGPISPLRHHREGDTAESLQFPLLDVCIMNPPFTRSVGGNLLFGHVRKDRRPRLQAALRRLIDKQDVAANVTGGLGTVFVALGNRLLKQEGTLALVLPKACLSGVSWQPTRDLLANNYSIDVIITSHEPNGWHFSENSDYSECLVIARKSEPHENATKVVNLWRKPASSIEALSVAAEIDRSLGADLGSSGTEELRVGSRKYGEMIRCSAREVSAGHWGAVASFAQTELARAAHYLQNGKVYIPSLGIVSTIPTVPLGGLVKFGPDCRDIHDAFEATDNHTEYAAFWGHKTGVTNAMAISANAHLKARTRAQEGRPKRDAELMWSRAGRVLIAERLRLNTARVIAGRSARKLLSNTWWPLNFGGNGIDSSEIERCIVLWLNSTFGVLSVVASRVETSGAWIKLKKPLLQDLRVLNPTALKASQREKMVNAYERLSKQPLASFKKISTDHVRAEIDEAIARALGVSNDTSIIRELLSHEPAISGRMIEPDSTPIRRESQDRLFGKSAEPRKRQS
jgi:hypothetical protein